MFLDPNENEFRKLIRNAIMDRHHSELVKSIDELVRRLVTKKVFNPSDHEDVIQKIQIAVSSQLQGIADKDDPRTFVLAIARNQILEHRRKSVTGSRAIVAVSSPAVQIAEPVIATDDHLEQAEILIKLEEFIETLPSTERVILAYRFKDGLSYADISKRLRLSEHRAQKLLESIIEAGRKWFEDGGRDIARQHHA